MGELKPCPFCGGEAQRLTIGENEPNNAGGDVIHCTRCQASSRVEFGRKEHLVSAWNGRAETREAELRIALVAARGWVVTCSESRQARRDLAKIDAALAQENSRG